MYLFGGNDGSKALNDVYFLDMEKLLWIAIQVHVSDHDRAERDDVKDEVVCLNALADVYEAIYLAR